MRRDPSELRVRKPEVISIHRLLPRGSLESRRQTEANGFMGLGPSGASATTLNILWGVQRGYPVTPHE
jgi:hypothetical protein